LSLPYNSDEPLYVENLSHSVTGDELKELWVIADYWGIFGLHYVFGYFKFTVGAAFQPRLSRQECRSHSQIGPFSHKCAMSQNYLPIMVTLRKSILLKRKVLGLSKCLADPKLTGRDKR